MKIISSLLPVITMICGLLVPFFENESEPSVVIMLLLLAAAFISAAAVGSSWFSDITRAKSSGNFDMIVIRKIIALNNSWLQLLIPRSEIYQHLDFEITKKGEVNANAFLSSFVFGLAMLALGGVLAIQLHDQNSRGVFGAILNFTLGRAIFLMFSLYLLISSVSVLMVGLLFKFNSWRV